MCAAITAILDCTQLISQSEKKTSSQNPPPGSHFEAMGLSLLCYFQGSSTTLTIIRLVFNAITVILTNKMRLHCQAEELT